MTQEELEAVRQAVADYMAAEGCSCCRNEEAHREARERLGTLLKAERYPDGGHNFRLYRSPA